MHDFGICKAMVSLITIVMDKNVHPKLDQIIVHLKISQDKTTIQSLKLS